MANMNVEDKDCIYPKETRTFILLDASNLIIMWRPNGIEICEGGVGNHNESKGKILVQKGAVGKLELRLTVQTRFTIEGGRSGEGWISWEPATDVDQKLHEIQKLSYTTREYSETGGYRARCIFDLGGWVGNLVSVIVKVRITFSFYEGLIGIKGLWGIGVCNRRTKPR
ncbi:hypothetical protein NE237_001409 [Protea cynaroides]|uniref:Uncharacterized protein n=1 Tax=Protea cynaroides TaxID=273540 RepID=A0A9Q0QY28_9MAGN|nr:hypothetical protein NE237_001409 [Protea cynaroides]